MTVTVTHQKLFNNAIISARRLIDSDLSRCADRSGNCMYTIEEHHCFIGETVPEATNSSAAKLIANGVLSILDLEKSVAQRAAIDLQCIHDYTDKDRWIEALKEYAKIWNLSF